MRARRPDRAAIAAAELERRQANREKWQAARDRRERQSYGTECKICAAAPATRPATPAELEWAELAAIADALEGPGPNGSTWVLIEREFR